MGNWKETKEAYSIEESMDSGFCHDPYKAPLPEYCSVCLQALELSPSCYYCMLNDKCI